MRFLIVACLAALAVAANGECQENAHYNDCGSACPTTCENYRNPPKFCIRLCVPGCHCDEDYVKTKDGQCVLPDDCPTTSNDGCGENQEFVECGSACPDTCDNYKEEARICTAQCVQGCRCKKGYVKNRDGECVLPEKCPSQQEVCGENQEYATCGTACPLTCDNYNDPPKVCTLQCVLGCHCKEGYVKTSDGRCVLPENCPSKASPVCHQSLEIGKCMAYFHRYGFDVKQGKCVKFVYGGCGGNENNFNTLEECRNTCLTEFQLQRPDCDLDAEPGKCKAFLKRWHYEDGQCKEFVYGGCGGNRNNFKTEEECYNQCGALRSKGREACAMEMAVGPCRAAFRRFYFNQLTNACEPFIYGGCGGNSNNFNELEDCAAVCLAK